MIPVIMLGVAGILFMLGVISMQIVWLKPEDIFARIVMTLLFLACTALSLLIAVAALTSSIPTL
jgi:hypothetical protein